MQPGRPQASTQGQPGSQGKPMLAIGASSRAAVRARSPRGLLTALRRGLLLASPHGGQPWVSPARRRGRQRSRCRRRRPRHASPTPPPRHQPSPHDLVCMRRPPSPPLSSPASPLFHYSTHACAVPSAIRPRVRAVPTTLPARVSSCPWVERSGPR